MNELSISIRMAHSLNWSGLSHCHPPIQPGTKVGRFDGCLTLFAGAHAAITPEIWAFFADLHPNDAPIATLFHLVKNHAQTNVYRCARKKLASVSRKSG